MAFKIGEVKSIGDPVSWAEQPKDRVYQTECINGTYTQDLGLDESGLVLKCSLVVSESDYQKLLEYRKLKNYPVVTDHRGNFLGNRMFKITNVQFEIGTPFRVIEIELYPVN